MIPSVRFRLEISHDGLVGRRAGLGDLWLDGLVERQGLYLMSPQSVVVAGLRVIIHPADVPDGAEVEDGVKPREDLLGCHL